ncbi:MAG: DNA repair protein RecN [Oscillospiraceae bacterium]|nr:DNA repair protein RecN [Oscillospiraceae bacterium]
MLKELHIKNIAVIDEVRLTFDRGFAALTGETGAGKSILIDSINMVLGERTARDLVRRGADRAEVNAVFSVTNPQILEELAKMGIEIEDDLLILSRDLTAEGKGSCRINGRTSTLSMVRDAGKFLLNIHGQHDNQTLLTPKTHINFVDKFGGTAELLQKYSAAYKLARETAQKIETITANEAEKTQRLDFLRFQIDEIADAKLIIGEDVELAERCEFLSNIEKISDAIHAAHNDIYGGEQRTAHDLLDNAARELEIAARYDKRITPFYESVNSILIELREVSIDIASYIDSIEFDPHEQERAQARANLIFNLKRKYGEEISDILEYYEKISQESAEIESSDETLEKLKLDLHIANENMQKLSAELSIKRRNAAKTLEEKITAELEDLDMKRVQFSVKIEDLYDENGAIRYGANGQDNVEFMISANVGEDLKPLSKIASGGEMSRIMLAIKSILASSDTVDTLIFDEIDAGVSGRAAQKIAEKIRKISKDKLIICVTHLAQLAAMADRHYLVQKDINDERTSTQVIKLDKAGRTYELARIIGGVTVTDLTLQNAEEMLKMAEESRQACTNPAPHADTM